VSLRRRFMLYLAGSHAAAAAVVLPRLAHDRAAMLVAELLFVASFVAGLRLIRRLFGPLEVVQVGAHFLQESDFMSRLRSVGQPEMDNLVRVYNQMADHLRDERTRLQEQHQFLSQILQESPSSIMVLDFDGRIELVNPAAERLLDRGAGTLQGRALTEIPSPLAAAMSRLGAGEARVIRMGDGRRVKCRRGSFLDRGFTRCFFLMEELTEELRQVEKDAYEKLIRIMSHEVNNSVGACSSLLNSCLSYIPALAEEHREDMQTALQVVIGRTEQLAALMRSFAEVVRLPTPQLRPCDPEAILRRVAVLMRAECEKRRITWRWDVQVRCGLVPMDAVQMEQVFVNIVKNGLEAIGSDGTITVRLARQVTREMVIIEDTGPGIQPEAQANLFTPFFSTKKTGQGIGLALIQHILSQHRFEFSLEGPVGGPTEFTIRF
jgi:two-component system, NtrC family, nitrogen regulation sensor histidine kinase NtrY